VSELNYYARYKKYGRAKYISHLDMVRMFNRVFRRGGIPIAYSEGFNPHPKISFALPLPVFFESECEILLFSLSEDTEPKVLMERFAAVMPEGLTITEVKRGTPNVKKLTYARYLVSAKLPTEAELENFLKLKELVVPKKTKKGINDTDIREDIKDIKIEGSKLAMILSAGSQANLKPDVALAAMNKYIEGYESGSADYLRTDILDNELNPIR